MKMHFVTIVLAFFLLPDSLYAEHSLSADTIPGLNESVSKKKSFRFGLQLAGSINYIDYGTLRLLDIAPNYNWGGNIGFSFDWKVTRYNHIRFETFYEYQRLSEKLDNEYNNASVIFTNQAAGINFFPVVLKVGKKFQPQIALGSELKYLLVSERQAMLNGRNLDLSMLEPNPLQYGLIFGIGAYINRTLLEFRVQRSMVNFLENTTTDHAVTQMKFVINL